MDSNEKYKKGALIQYTKRYSEAARAYNLQDDIGMVLGPTVDMRALPIFWFRLGKRFDICVELPGDAPVFDIVLEAPVVE